MWQLLSYQLRLAARSLYGTRALSSTIVVGLALAGGMWTFGVGRYLRHHGPYPRLSPALHQVDLSHGETPTLVRSPGSTHSTASWATHTRVTFPEYTALAASGLPMRQTGTFRSRLLVSSPGAREGAALARVVHGRFVEAAFFSLFAVPIGRGRPFSADEQQAGAPVVVLGARLAEALGAGATTVLVEGRPFRVVGVVRGDQPFRPTWDIAALDTDQDALYLPFGWFRPLRARPETMVQRSPVGTGLDELLRSDAIFVSFWAELPTSDIRERYRRYLDQRFGGRYRLRSYAEWTEAFVLPGTRVAFISFLTGLLLVGGGLSVTRLLMAKGIARRAQLGIHRALGASRTVMFAGQMLEALLLVLPAALAAVLLALPQLALFNRVVADVDIPARLTGATALLGGGGVLLVGLASALYPAWRFSRTPPTVTMDRS